MNNQIDKSMQAGQYFSSVQQCEMLLDMDGVIDVNHDYVQYPENLELIDGIFKVAIKAYASSWGEILFAHKSPTELSGLSNQAIATLLEEIPIYE